MTSLTSITVYTDGGSRGNPGPSGSGVFSSEMGEFKEYIGVATNNQAEYHALYMALQAAVAYQAEHPSVVELNCFLDSELIVKQMNGEYKIKNAALKRVAVQIKALAKSFDSVTFTHVYREHNTEADRLVNEAIDEALAA